MRFIKPWGWRRYITGLKWTISISGRLGLLQMVSELGFERCADKDIVPTRTLCRQGGRLWDPTSVGERDKTFLTRMWKPLPKKRVLKTNEVDGDTYGPNRTCEHERGISECVNPILVNLVVTKGTEQRRRIPTSRLHPWRLFVSLLPTNYIKNQIRICYMIEIPFFRNWCEHIHSTWECSSSRPSWVQDHSILFTNLKMLVCVSLFPY